MRAAAAAVRTLLTERWQSAFAVGRGDAGRHSSVRHALAKSAIEMVANDAQHVLHTASTSIRGRIGHTLAESAIEMVAYDAQHVLHAASAGIRGGIGHALAKILIEVAPYHTQYVLNALAAPRNFGITTLPANER